MLLEDARAKHSKIMRSATQKSKMLQGHIKKIIAAMAARYIAVPCGVYHFANAWRIKQFFSKFKFNTYGNH